MKELLQTPGIASRLLVIDVSYFLTAVLFVMGLKRMSSPVTARSGIVWAGAGMAVATLVSFLYPGMSNFELIIAAIVVGSLIAWWSGKKVAMTDMPQMIALYQLLERVAIPNCFRRGQNTDRKHHAVALITIRQLGG